MSAPVVIVGSGLAGYNLAREWRKLDAVTPLLIISADDGRSYSKPMLSTGFAKNKQADELSMAEVGAMAQQLNAEIRSHSRVTAIEPQHNCLWLGEERIVYRDLILAVGAAAVQLTPGGDREVELYTVNDLHDYARFRQAAAGQKRVLLLGAGLIGCEFANDLLSGGYQVELVAPSQQVMPDLLPVAAAAAVQAGLEALGARFHLGQVLDSVQRTDAGYLAQLSDGSQLSCDVLLAAAGLRPRIELAQAAGLAVQRGIVVDRQLRSSAAHIYALGDCAEVAGLNLLYVMPLMACARALAQTLAGNPTEVKYGAMPVTVKTPVCPLVVSPVPPGLQGDWTVEGDGADIKALCHDKQGALLGYALTGVFVQERLALNKALPALLV